MKINTLLSAPSNWSPTRNDSDGVIMGSIVRMVRNLAGFPFPGWSTAESRAAVAERVLPVIKNIQGFKTAFCAELSQLSYGQRRALLTRKQLTPCMAARQDGCHVIIPQRRRTVLMVNEEEHIVVHSFQDGLNLKKGIREMQQLADQLEDELEIAYSHQHGYLTSIPSEAGDGLQLYSLLHLPGLTCANMMNQVTKALEKLHVSISPYYSDTQDDTGHQYVLYSIPGPEDTVDEMLDNFENIIMHLVQREQQVRRKLLVDSNQHLQDAIGRAYGLLTNCLRLSMKELRDTISLLRLGTLLGIIRWEEEEKDILIALNTLSEEQACLTGLAEDNGTPNLFQQRARTVREFLHNHPHYFSES